MTRAMAIIAIFNVTNARNCMQEYLLGGGDFLKCCGCPHITPLRRRGLGGELGSELKTGVL